MISCILPYHTGLCINTAYTHRVLTRARGTLARNTNTRQICTFSSPDSNHSLSQSPRSPPRWTTMKPAEKHFRCTICQRGFTRIDHLKRHHLRRMYCFLHPDQLAYARADSGQKPYSCVFCNKAFARWYVRENSRNFLISHPYFFSDNLRDHYAECAQRGDRKIPETGQRGRRRHACLSVSNHCARRDLPALLIVFRA